MSTSTISWFRLVLFLGCCVLGSWNSNASPSPVKAAILPSDFLRLYDPVSVVFSEDVRPTEKKEEDQGSRYFRIVPAVNGSYQWLDKRTLEFRPAQAWDSLSRYAIKVSKSLPNGLVLKEETQKVLRTLLEEPLRFFPANQSKNIPLKSTISIEWKDEIPLHSIRKSLSIEIEKVEATPTKRKLAQGKDWILRKSLLVSKQNSYEIVFPRALPKNHKVTVILSLALQGLQKKLEWESSFTTLVPFVITKVDCGSDALVMANGSLSFSANRALSCGSEQQVLTLHFSNSIQAKTRVFLQQLLELTPKVSHLVPKIFENKIEFRGRFQPSTLYQVSLQKPHLELKDQFGQGLTLFGKKTFFLFADKKKPTVSWKKDGGLLERHGPMMLPLYSRYYEALDIRIHAVRSTDRRFEFFPSRGVSVDESVKPPAPGEKPKSFGAWAVVKHIQGMRSPVVSKIVLLPKKVAHVGGTFGLNLRPLLKPFLERNRVHFQTNTFLVGYRPVFGTSVRKYVKIQISDLALSVVEGKNKVNFVVTSNHTALPVANAKVSLLGRTRAEKLVTVWSGKTDAQGMLSLAPDTRNKYFRYIEVQTEDDQLFLAITTPPPVFMQNHWSASYKSWLSWLAEEKQEHLLPEKYLGHMFPERPIYKPGETIHLTGLLRKQSQGKLELPEAGTSYLIEVKAPGNKKWTIPFKDLSAWGSFSKVFNHAKGSPTGYLSATLYRLDAVSKRHYVTSCSFQVTDYRVPKFKATLFGARKVSSSEKFSVYVAGRYYSGGVLVGAKVLWKVTERNAYVSPATQKDYHFSSSYWYSQNQRYSSKVILQTTRYLNHHGISLLELDPTKSLYSRPVQYDIEATIEGADGQNISARKWVRILAPFQIGLNVGKRFHLQKGSLKPKVIAMGVDEKNVSKIPVQLTLFRREWHYQLLETDLMHGKAQFKTDFIDRPVARCKVTTAEKPVSCELPLQESGIFLLKAQARDRLGRLQTVAIDLFVRGKDHLTWEPPKAGVFQLSLAQEKYAIGETAQLLIRSPFQKGRALVILEDPKGTQYHWVSIEKGQGLFDIPIQEHNTPNLWVHVQLIQGRTSLQTKGHLDLGRPVTYASSKNIQISPDNHKVLLAMKFPKEARPGQTITIQVQLTNHKKEPISGEVTLWGVDEAVLSLANERKIDPLQSFVFQKSSHTRLRDTRNLLIGNIPTSLDNPGGDGKPGALGYGGGGRGRRFRYATKMEGIKDMLAQVMENKASMVRKDFRTVAFFKYGLKTDANGIITIQVKLPDNLTSYSIRGMALHGTSRFGYQSKSLRVTLPVMVQRTFPRFVRPGDLFKAGALARVTDEKGGKASIRIQAKGLLVKQSVGKEITLDAKKSTEVFASFEVPNQASQEVQVTMTIQREVDKAKDGFAIKVPVHPDRRRLYLLQEKVITDWKDTLDLGQKWPEPIRKGSGKIEVLLAGNSTLFQALAALEYNLDYPYGCIEQRVSRAFPLLVLENTLKKLALKRMTSKRIRMAVEETIASLKTAQAQEGLFSLWPGGSGHVWLTAYVVPFLVEAQKAGWLSAKSDLLAKAVKALHKSLQSDSYFLASASDKASVLHALAKAGEHAPSYLRMLFLQRKEILLFGQSRLLLAMLEDKANHKERIEQLTQELWSHIRWKKSSKEYIFYGINFVSEDRWYGYSLESPTKTLAGLLEALSYQSSEKPKLLALKKALLHPKGFTTYGYGWRKDGKGASWGNTHDNARALLALKEYLQHNEDSFPKIAFRYHFSSHQSNWNFIGGKGQGIQSYKVKSDVIPQIQFQLATDLLQKMMKKQKLFVRVRASYIPLESGKKADSKQKGFSLLRSSRLIDTKGNVVQSYDWEKGKERKLSFGGILEEKVRFLNTKTQYNLVIDIPLASGLELMNPTLKTSSTLATPSEVSNIRPSYVEYLEDKIRFFFDKCPQGDHFVTFRVQANFEGIFVLPPAHMELMYQPTTFGTSVGMSISVQK